MRDLEILRCNDAYNAGAANATPTTAYNTTAINARSWDVTSAYNAAATPGAPY